jgi:hypothetical protein
MEWAFLILAVIAVIPVLVGGWRAWQSRGRVTAPPPERAQTLADFGRPIAVHVAHEPNERKLDEILEEERERTVLFHKVREDYVRDHEEHSGDQYAVFSQPLIYFRAPSSTRVDPHLSFSFRWWGDWRVLCIARAPSGHLASAIALGWTGGGGNNFSLTYPSSFSGDAAPLEPGTWLFAWARVGSRTDEGWKVGATFALDRVEVTEEMLALMVGATPVVHHEAVRPDMPSAAM